jgi:hypothetical protein
MLSLSENLLGCETNTHGKGACERQDRPHRPAGKINSRLQILLTRSQCSSIQITTDGVRRSSSAISQARLR